MENYACGVRGKGNNTRNVAYPMLETFFIALAVVILGVVISLISGSLAEQQERQAKGRQETTEG